MRRKDKEIEDKSIIEEILNHSEICRIALIDGDRSYIVPMNYGFSGNCLYFHSASSGRKIDLIQEGGKVCFEMEQGSEIIRREMACNWTARYRSVIGYGTIEILTGREDKIQGLDIIMKHYGKMNNQYIESNVDRIVILKLTIDEISAKQSGDW
ncbi:MAG: pyridoxamine 5'-phosphate oxidase family protein [Bacteroidales bacterium]|nr:pyridoxamine 5'-phosphate oxidase family protein [Bacteroidales bacterium]